MTSVNGVERVVYAQPQERKGKNTALRHIGNAVLTGAGVAGTVELSKYVANNADKLLYNDICNKYKYVAGNEPTLYNIPKFTTKLIRKFQKIGELIFREGGVVNKILTKITPKLKGETAADFAQKITYGKGNTVMGIAAGATVLAFLVRGIFKAGEIKGESK